MNKKQRVLGRLKNVRRRSRSFIHTRNFSDLEDNAIGFKIIGNIAVRAGLNAAAEAMAAGIQRTYARNGRELVSVSPTGEVTIIPAKAIRIRGVAHQEFYVKHKPGTILHATKK